MNFPAPDWTMPGITAENLEDAILWAARRMQAAESRLACFTDVTVCDGPGQHDVEVWTDGDYAYAHVVAGEYGTTKVSRDLTQIEVACPHVTLADETCTGYARYDLATECWTADGRALQMLASHGERIEQ